MLSRAIIRSATPLRAQCAARYALIVRQQQPRILPPKPMRLTRGFASEGKSAIDEKIEEIQEQYATAKDEFEIAMEETESNTVYAQDDRDAAREEFDKLKNMFHTAIADGENGEEIQRRIGQRIKELESAVKTMEELAQNQD